MGNRRRSHRSRGLLLTAAAVVTAIAVPTGARGALAPEDVPAISVDAGRFTLPITCTITIPALGNAKLLQLPTNVDVQGVVATQFGPGQKFSLSQGKGSLTIPGTITQIAKSFGDVDTAETTITSLLIGATRARPDVLNVATQPLKTGAVKLTPGEPLTVGLPKTGTFTVGPYTAPQSGIVTLRFDGASADIDLTNSRNGFKLPTLHAECEAVAGKALLSVDVGGARNQAPSLIKGAPLNFPTVPSGDLIGIVNAPYRCRLLGETVDAGVAVGGRLPLTIPRGGAVTVEEGEGALTIPAKTVDRLRARGHRSVTGLVKRLDLVTQGATPARQNVIPKAGLIIPKTALRAHRRILLPLPAKGTLPVTPAKANAGSKSVVVSVGAAEASFRFDGGKPVQATCTPPAPRVILANAEVTG